MKKLLILLTSLLLLLVSSPVYADMGPKPSVTVSFQHAPDHPYYVTLLGTEEFFGPWSTISEEEIANHDDSIRPAYEAFYACAKENGLYFSDYVTDCSSDDTFRWTYYPPSSFRIAVYDSMDHTLKVSDLCKREAFDSYFIVDLEGPELIVKEDAHLTPYLLSFVIRMILTVLIELLIAWIFGYRTKKEKKIIVITNIITQCLLNGIMLSIDYYSGLLVWLFIFPVLELGVFVIELLVYLFLFKEHKKLKTFFYTLIANGLTFLLGIYLAMITASF